MIYLERGYFSFKENHALWSFNKHTRHRNSVKDRPDKVIRLNNPLRYVRNAININKGMRNLLPELPFKAAFYFFKERSKHEKDPSTYIAYEYKRIN